MRSNKLIKIYEGLFALNIVSTIIHYIYDTGFAIFGVILIAICAIMIYLLKKCK